MNIYEPLNETLETYEKSLVDGKSKRCIEVDGKKVDIVTGENCTNDENACVVRKVTELDNKKGSDELSDDMVNRKMLHPITVKYSDKKIAKIFKNENYTYYLLERDEKNDFKRIERNTNMGSIGYVNNSVKVFNIDREFEVIDIKCIYNTKSRIITEFVIVKFNSSIII